MRNRTPRKIKNKRNKLILKRGILVYDLACMPKNKMLKDILYEFHNYGLVVYNSQAHGNVSGVNINYPPFVINPKSKIKTVDSSLFCDEK